MNMLSQYQVEEALRAARKFERTLDVDFMDDMAAETLETYQAGDAVAEMQAIAYSRGRTTIRLISRIAAVTMAKIQ